MVKFFSKRKIFIFFLPFVLILLAVLGYFYIQYTQENERIKNVTSKIEELNQDLKLYDIETVLIPQNSKSQDLQKLYDQKKEEFDKYVENLKKNYSLYRDQKIKEYSYIPVLDVNKYLPQSEADAKILKSPQIAFNYEIAQQEIDKINAVDSTHYYLNSFDVNSVISKMSLHEKVQSLFMWYVPGTKADDFAAFIKQNNPAGLIIMGDNASANLKSTTASITKSSKYPLLIAIDEEGGTVKRLKEDNFPYSALLKFKDPIETTKAFESRTALLKNYGINTNFGIVADITGDKNSFIYNRVFGVDPVKVNPLISAAVKASKLTFSTLKHFPGHGRTNADSHISLPTVKLSLDDWKKTDMLPFKSGIDAGANLVMFGHLKYINVDSEPASLSVKWHEILRKDLGYQGVTITDAMGMLESTGLKAYNSAEKAINAGNDIILYVSTSFKPKDMIDHIENKVKDGTISEAKINESLQHSLKLRQQSLYL